MTNQSLTLEFGKHSQRFFDRSLRRLRDSSNPKIDDIQHFESEISKTFVNSVNQFLTCKSMDPRFVFAAATADVGNNDQPIRLGMERPPNDFICYVRTARVAAA